MYWWDKAASLVGSGDVHQFGLITTNSLRQTFNRKVVQRHLNDLSLVFTVPDHPWVDTAEGAAVRIAMTVAVRGTRAGELQIVTGEAPQDDGSSVVTFLAHTGRVASDLTTGADVSSAAQLRANENLALQGVIPLGEGFRLNIDELKATGYSPDSLPSAVRDYWIGSDIVRAHKQKWVIDFFGLSADDARTQYPSIYQRVLTLVRPERDQNKRDSRRKNWWLFAENVVYFRRAAVGLSRFIATCRTAKHRIFVFLPGDALPDAKIVAVALDDPFYLGVLSARTHSTWALATGAFLEDRPNYNHSECFAKFPFPACDEAAKARIRSLGEELDAHRKRVQAHHPGLSLTVMYNVLEALRAGRAFTSKEQAIHNAGLVSVLRQLHDDLDAAVAAAYGWPNDLADAEILTRLVALNAERAAEEAEGKIRWLRPAYQAPAGATTQGGLSITPAAAKTSKRKLARAKEPWPKTLPERVLAVERALRAAEGPTTSAAMAKRFLRAKPADLEEILETLATLGRAHRVGHKFSA